MAAVLMIDATTPSFNLVVVFVVGFVVVIALLAAVFAVVGEDGFGWSTSRPRSAAAGP